MGENDAVEDSGQIEARACVSTFIRRVFCPVILFGQISGIAAISLSIAWTRTMGFDWTDKDQVISYHPVLLTVAMLYLHGQGILIYRLFRNKAKWILKRCHAVIQLFVFGITCVGLQAAFNSHNWRNIPNLYSLHSWVGLSLVVCFSAQLVLGFLIFLLPYASLNLRITYLPLHRVFGLIMFGIAGATALMGITELAIFNVPSNQCWKNRTCNLADIINWMGLSILLYISSVLYLVATPEYRRIPLPTD